MMKKPRKKPAVHSASGEYFDRLAASLSYSKQAGVLLRVQVNAVMTATYWEIGHRGI